MLKEKVQHHAMNRTTNKK